MVAATMAERAGRLGPARIERDRLSTDPATPNDEGAGREAWELLFGLFPGIRANLVAACAEFDLTPAQGRLLHFLDPRRPVPMADLACLHGCDASNITGLVDRLEARGLIARAPNPADRRVKMIVVTPAGTELRRRLLDRISHPPAFIRALSPSDQRRLRDILRKATLQSSPIVERVVGEST
jgi:DNA-binding MarR family transcriptional regulator